MILSPALLAAKLPVLVAAFSIAFSAPF